MRLAYKWLLVVAAVLLSATVSAAPFVVSDPLDALATHCGVLLNTAQKVEVPVAPSGTGVICKFDLTGIPTGTHVVKMTAIAEDSLWGRLESATSVPFTFSKPSVPGVPSGLAITP